MGIRETLGYGCESHDEDNPECEDCALRRCPLCNKMKPQSEFHPDVMLYDCCLVCWSHLPGMERDNA